MFSVAVIAPLSEGRHREFLIKMVPKTLSLKIRQIDLQKQFMTLSEED